MSFALQLGASLVAILALAWLAHWLQLGGDARIRDEEHARELAAQVDDSFEPAGVDIDSDGTGALLTDAAGRQLRLRRHGAHFVGDRG